jgi:hypothetical protein
LWQGGNVPWIVTMMQNKNSRTTTTTSSSTSSSTNTTTTYPWGHRLQIPCYIHSDQPWSTQQSCTDVSTAPACLPTSEKNYKKKKERKHQHQQQHHHHHQQYHHYKPLRMQLS